jgi:uncharacterized protein (DUF2236 family)
MGRRMLPTEEEVFELVPGPGSITWERAADARTLLAAGYALVLQVSHPVVGAGVADHSSYRQDPWGRLFRTLDLTTSLVYATPQEASAVARGVRARHRQIKGVRPDGGRYHALEPDAYAWVWASLFNAITCAHKRFGRPLDVQQHERFWSEWRRLGRLLGVRERDLPATLNAYEGYFQDVVQELLEDNASVRGVLASIDELVRPPLPRYVEPAWRIGSRPGAHALRLATVGMLPPVLRERFALGWTPTQELELSALGATSRALTPLMPRALREYGPSYRRWRRRDAGRPAVNLASSARSL